MADENMPPGITEKQDEIIQYVAKYVVNSCDGARYQEKIRTRTKYNSYFAFLDAKHPYHHYYQYLLDSYRYYLLNSEAVNAGVWGGIGDGSGTAHQQQQQLTEAEYYQYYGAYQDQAGGIGFKTGEEATAGYYEDPNKQDTSSPQQLQEGGSTASINGDSGHATGSGSGGVSVVGNTPSAVEGQGEANAAQDGAGEVEGEEEEEEYELVMENGEWVSRKRN
ncbi:putative RNA binding protein [Leptomonas seymouri]|uniref:Putative RNA binding protein n=1 Tax=Leptomonas seymouri TaxID=5684 RepID=A0A0N1PET4_LEPSE|nr:putative RNA binding protein [Leptomonas seymouri]|eukprot:KPI89175.1 putative RNA binding protein [Leptomonas seymouri]